MRNTVPYFVLVLAVFSEMLIPVGAATLQSDEYFAWGIDADDVAIPVGSIITEAVLTIQNPNSTNLYVHLLDNPDVGGETNQDDGQGNIFDGFGEALQGQMEDGNLVFRFSQIDNPDSDAWSEFQAPFNFTLPDSSTVGYTSSLLKLIDYAGTGRSFGIGVDSENGASLEGITLDIIISAYTEQGENFSTLFALDLKDDLIIGSMKPDFNADGKTDLLWRENSTGAYKAVMMDGFVQIEEATLGGSYDSLKIVGTGDFNGDGKSDLLWRQISTGSYIMWLMDGTTKQQEGYLGGDLDWEIIGTGDFNGDGKSDLLWHHILTGTHIIWLMDGTTKQQDGYLGGSLDWKITGTGDFNGDNKEDVIWYHVSTGTHIIWLMNGTTKQLDGYLGGNLDWEVVEWGDFDGDSKTDVIWRQVSTGTHIIWLMDGTTKQVDGHLGGDLDWKVIGTGDFNGDNKADIIWNQVSTGTHIVWLMSGLTKQQDGYLGGSMGWEVMP